MIRRKPLHAHLHKLHGVRLKLTRARLHADELEKKVQAWFDGHPYGVFGQYEPGSPEHYVFRVRFLDPIPPEWAVILGDFIHNARSALDHLAYVVVSANNGGIHEWTGFPIALSPFEWPSQAKRGIGSASDRHIDLIERFQPYHRPDFGGWKWLSPTLDDPLAILQRLSNIDKHIVLNATPVAIESIGFDVQPVRDVKAVGVTEVNHGVLVDGEYLVRVAIESDGPHPELELERSETVKVGVQYRVDLGTDSYALKNVDLKQTLQEIMARLWQIFEVFVGELR